MAARTKSPTIKDPDQYDALRDEGMSKEKAARIANASARDGRGAVDLRRLAVDEHVHAATSAKRAGSQAPAQAGSGSPVKSSATACAVTSASRIPLR